MELVILGVLIAIAACVAVVVFWKAISDEIDERRQTEREKLL
jgi:hypothetical protein